MNWFVICFAAMPIILSSVVMVMLRVTLEYGRPSGLLHPKTQSWAFLFGDTIVLPITFGVTAVLWSRGSPEVWSRNMGLLISAAIAVVVSGAFRYGDAKRYRSSQNADRLRAPTKLWHDLVVYPVLVMALVYFGIPALIVHFGSTECWLMLGGLALWLVLGLIDVFMIKPNPAKQHPRWQDTWPYQQAN